MSTYITKRAKELGLRKVDGKAPLVLDVAACDIRRGSMKDPGNCGFARAAKRQYKCKAAYFFRTAAWLEYPDKMVRYVLPPSMQKEIVAFDRNKTMETGAYQLTPPEGSRKLGAVAKRSAKRPGRHHPGAGKIKRKVVHRTTNIRGLLGPV